ncbi:MAG TPA: N-formylglutamate deformylase [Casimicrobiaceae bacterium]|nr:N-formylglutamate deformylase [Casimicrobiaceae bacterium]
MMLLWQLHQGDSPLIVSVPHAGRHVPDAIALRMQPNALALPDTDFHVDRLYRFVPATGATFVVATHSRYVVDLNRDPSGAALYPGADNTELCPTRTFANDAIYLPGEAPSGREIAARRATFFDPYQALLATQIARVHDRHGHALLLDGHSIAAVVPRFFAGRLPDLNLGTADGHSCAPSVEALAAGVLSRASGFTHVVNGRFKGGYITRHFGAPDRRVHALQLEMVQDCYMDESQPNRFDPARAARVIAMLERLVIALSEWRP